MLFLSLSAAGHCGLGGMINLGVNLPVGEFAQKDKALALRSASRSGVAYELAVKFYRSASDEGDLVPRYGFSVSPPSEISGNFYYSTIEGAVLFDIPIGF